MLDLEKLVFNFIGVSKKEKVGFIGNYVTFEILSNYFNIIDLSERKNINSNENESIKNLIIESDIYEQDNMYYEISNEEIRNNLNNFNVYSISTGPSNDIEVSNSDIYIDSEISDVTIKDNKLYLPILINEKIYNPSNSDNKFELLIFYLNESDNIEYLKRFINDGIVQKANPDKITRQFIKSLLDILNNTNILLLEDKHIDTFLAKYIELIAVSQNVHVIVDSKNKGLYEYAEIKRDENHLINLIRYFILNSDEVNKNKVKNFRQLMLSNSVLFLNKTKPKISVTLVSMREERLKRIFMDLSKQKSVSLQVVLLTHGYTLSEEKIQELLSLGNFDLKVISGDKSLNLGECLNMCIDYIENDYVVKMDDDDFYYSNFIIDLYIGLSYSQAQIVGKYGFYFYLNALNLVGQRRADKEFKNVSEVKGNGIFCKTSLLKNYGFSKLSYGEDSDLFERVRNDKGKIYSIHSFDMCVFRDGDKNNHSYKVNDINFLRDAKTIYFGEPNNTISTE